MEFVEVVVETTTTELPEVPWLGLGFVVDLLDVLLCPCEIDELVALPECVISVPWVVCAVVD